MGVGRGLTDLAAVEDDFAKAEASGLHFSRGLAAANGGCGGVQRRARRSGRRRRRGRDRRHRGGVRGPTVQHRHPRWATDEIDPIREAIRYEAQAVIALGLIVALVVATFVGQAIVRQSRREWSDGPILRAIGVTAREAERRPSCAAPPSACPPPSSPWAPRSRCPRRPGRGRARRRGRPRGGVRRHGAARRRAGGDRRRDRRGADPARSASRAPTARARWRSAHGRGGRRRCPPWPRQASSSRGGAPGRRSR